MDRLKGPDAAASVVYRKPTLADAAAVHTLIQRCGELDVNSRYAYLLLCRDFAETCAIAELEREPVGFASGYLKPSDPSVLFIWQVAVSPDARGFGVGKGLLREVLGRPACDRVEQMEATITPSNQASWALFHSLARERGALCARSLAFRVQDFGGQQHEEEHLLRIGPIEERRE
jgi:L-2,4-diaminobutyric acid acetyltransferase